MAMRLLCVDDQGVRAYLKHGETYTLRQIIRCPTCGLCGYFLREVVGPNGEMCPACGLTHAPRESTFRRARFIPLGDDNIKLEDEDTEERELVLVDRKEHLA